jgi:antirestriction protein
MYSEAKIYVADLAAYNSGILHGVWIDDLVDLDAIHEKVTAMLESSPVDDSEEYAVHDHEGFGELTISEFSSITSINQVALFLNEYPECGDIVFNYCNGDIDEANRMMNDCYLGKYESVEDYAQQIFEECYSVPSVLKYYICWERLGRDMLLNGEIQVIEVEGDVMIFSA